MTRAATAASGAVDEPPRVSLDQLDTLVEVTSVRAWVWLGALFMVCAGAVLFAVLYRVPKKVVGDGILLIAKDRLAQVRAPATGRLLRLAVALDQEVQKGALIGEITQDDLKDAIGENEARLRELQREDEQLTAAEDRERRTQEDAIALLEKSIGTAIKS